MLSALSTPSAAISPTALRGRRAVRRHHCVGGGPDNFGRRRGVDGQKLFSKIPETILFYLQTFLMTFFSRRKLQQNKYTSNNGIGGGATKSMAPRARPPP